MRIIAIIILALLAINIAFADIIGYTNESSKLWFTSYCAQPNVTIIAPNNTTVVNGANAISLTSNIFYYNFNATQVGNYYVSASCSNTSAFMLSSFPNIPAATVEAFDMILQSFLLFCIGILLLFVGEYLRNHLLTMLAGAWFLGIAGSLVFTGFATAVQGITFTFFLLMGLAVIFHGVSRLTQEMTERKRRRLEDDE